MAKFIEKGLKRFLSVLIAIALVVEMITLSSLTGVFAAPQSIFTVEIDSSIKGSISVILTNVMNETETRTESVTAGAATFSNFVDPENTYNINITGMIGYEDYHASGVHLDSTGISFTAADFNPLDTIAVSGQITDENGDFYTGGGSISYSGYETGSVTLGDNGSFGVTIYKSRDYEFSLTPTSPKYDSPVSLGTVNSSADVTDLDAQLSVKMFSITTSAGENGIISSAESSIPYGSNKSITAEADSSYMIATFTVDGTPVPEAVGLATYTHFFDNLDNSHVVDVTFAVKPWEITFIFNSDGTIEDGYSNPVVSGGKITANEGEHPSFTAIANENYHISSVVIDSATQADGTFDKAQTTYSHIFTDINADHSVTVTFSINTYNVAISSSPNGSVTVGGLPATPVQNVNHGESLTFTLIPVTGYDVEEVLLDGTPTDDYNLLSDGISYSYVISSITNNHTASVTFGLTETIAGDETNFYDIAAAGLMSGFPIVSGGKRVYNFINNSASATLAPKAPYSRIRINGSGNTASVQLTSSTLIEKIEIYKSNHPGKGWKIVPIEEPLQIIIDKTAPVVTDIPAMDWTSQDYTVTGTVTDEDTAASPSSGLSRIVWSKTALTRAQALSEATNTVPVIGGAYSFTIGTEQNNETFYVYAIDKADNVSAGKTIDVKIDKTKPEIIGFTFQKIEPPVVSKVINFLPFGTFYNEAIEVIVSAQDTGISSGLKEITLYSDGTAVETKTVAGSSATFKMTLAEFNDNEISASAEDIAGNKSVGKTKPTEVATNAHTDIVSLKTEKPTISIIPTSEAQYTDGEENWYAGNVGFTVIAETESAGIYSVIIKVNNQIITTDKNGKTINANFFETQTLQEEFTVNTDCNPLDGENIIEVIAVNNYGNEETSSIKVFIDTTNPKVVGFNIGKENDDLLSKIFNFLTWGNFFNKQVKITVIADDRYGAASGIGTITLYTDDEPVDGSPKAVTALDDGTYKAEFILPESVIPEARLLDVSLTAVAADNVANITGEDDDNPNGVPVTPAIVNSDLKSDRLIIETVNPVIDISSSEAVFIDSNNRKWYRDEALFIITIQDADSGIRSVQIKINGVDILTDADGKSVDSDFYNTETYEEIFRIDTSQGTCAIDGSYLIEVIVIDNAGNEYSMSDTAYKDIYDPSITGYRFIPATFDGIDETSEFIEFLEYGFYFKKEFTAIIEVSDQEMSSGLNRVEYRFVSYRDGMITDETSGTQIIVDGMAALTVPKGFKGQIFVEAFDNIGNISSEETPRAFVVDDTPPEIDITNSNSTSYNDANGNKLYVSDVSFTVAMSDNDSGIKEIGYSQSAENESFERKSILLENAGYSVGDILEDGWAVSEMESNLVTKVTKTFSFNADDNDIILTFDTTDRSGNTRESVQTEKITIDKTAPEINVVFRNDESKNSYYYNSNRIADITVIERNFDPGLIIADIENDFGQIPAISFEQVSNTEHTAVIDFDEGDYTFDVTGTDLGDNMATVNFSGENATQFYVDKTKPVIEDNFAEFSMNETKNSFNMDKTATIKVIEHNFSPDLMNLRIQMKEAGADHTSENLFDITGEVISGAEWESAGDIHTISFTLSRDAVYQIEMTPSDLAENNSDYISTVVFEIDQTAPVVKAKNGAPVKDDDIEFLDIYPYSRKDDPVPTVEFDDLNIDHINYVLTVYIPDYTSSEAVTVIRPVSVYLDEDDDKSGKIMGSIFTLPDFIKDGVYALELTAVDVAGNESLLNLNTYARMIEQDVLAYILESNLAKQTGIYSFQYENGDTISKRPDNFSDIKIFVLTKKDTGIDIVLRDNNADEINTNTQAATDDSIYGVGIYNFILKADFFKENFQDDTDVELYLTVKNEGQRIDLGKLHIDNIAPTCNLPEEFKSWNWYYGDEVRTITVSDISELIEENQCKVYDNGEEIEFEYSSEADTLVFTLEKGWHNVGIILDDMAGNANNIQEKVNIHIGFFWLWIIMVSSVTLTITIASAIIYNIRKKRILENG